MQSFYRNVSGDLLAVRVVGSHIDHPVQPVQLQLQRGIQVDADIGHGHPQQGIGADAQEYREHGSGSSQRQPEGGAGQASASGSPGFTLSGVPQEFFCGGLQLLAGPDTVEGFPDSVVLPHHISPPSAFLSIARPRPRSE